MATPLTSRRTGTDENVQTYGDGTRHFTSLATWEDEVDVNTTASGTATTEVLEFYADLTSFTDFTSVFGGTHDATHPLIVRTAAGHENKGRKSGGVIFTHNTQDRVFGCSDAFVYMFDFGVTMSTNNASGDIRPVIVDGANNIRSGLFIFDVESTGAGTIQRVMDVPRNDNGAIVDCIVSDPAEGDGIHIGSTTDNSEVYNNTVVGAVGQGFNIDNATNVLTNNLASGNGADFNGTVAAASTTNAASDGTAVGSSPRQNQTFTFVNPGTDYHLAAGDLGALGFGTNLSGANFAFDDDVDGQLREAVWDIGADQFVAGAGKGLTAVSNLSDIASLRG